jgi:kynurenine formamidase
MSLASPGASLVDLSQSVEHGGVTYRGLPAPLVCDYWTRESSRERFVDGVSFHIGKIEMVGNTGTYVDSPFHRYEDGKDLSELPLESLVHLEGIVVRAKAGERAVDVEQFASLRDRVRGCAVLVHTGWAQHWGTERYFEGNPFLTESAARWLVERGATLVGIDSVNIDDTEDKRRPAHSILLGANIPICEHLCNLESLPDKGFRFHAAPVKVKRFGTFPVRAYAIVD